QLFNSRRVLGRADNEDVADAREHEQRQGVVEDGLVIDRQKLLADDARQRVKPRACAARQDDALHRIILRALHTDTQRSATPRALSFCAKDRRASPTASRTGGKKTPRLSRRDVSSAQLLRGACATSPRCSADNGSNPCSGSTMSRYISITSKGEITPGLTT